MKFGDDEYVSPDSLSPEARAAYELSPSPLLLRLSDHYILDDDLQPVRVPMIEWAIWFEKHKHERQLRQEFRGVYFVSTVFLGLDHSFGDGGPPVLWETMIFDKRKWRRARHRDIPEPDGEMWRYRSLPEALAGHARAVEYVEVFRKGPRKLKKFLRRPYGVQGGRQLARRFRGVLARFDR